MLLDRIYLFVKPCFTVFAPFVLCKVSLSSRFMLISYSYIIANFTSLNNHSCVSATVILSTYTIGSEFEFGNLSDMMYFKKFNGL